MLICTLKKYNINEKIIDKIVDLYTNDQTTIKLGENKKKITVTSGIRQGCAISTLLFKMITYCIIEELKTRGVMYKSKGIELNSLWVADDVTLISNSIESTKGNSEINKIADMEVVKEIQYMGVTVGGRGRKRR